MPPMSRPLMTAWASVSYIELDPASGFHQRRAGIFLREYAREVTILPLHADRAAVDILAVGAELDLAAGRHRRIAGGNVERRQGLADLLRIGGSRALKRIDQHEGLRDQAAGIFETEFAGALLEFRIHLLGVVADVVIPVRHALQALGRLADVLVKIGHYEAAGAAVDRNVQANLPDGPHDQDQVVQIG